MYGRVLNAVPVSWLVGGLQAYNIVSGFLSGAVERVWSFLCAVFCNVFGLDTWYVLQDESPCIIPYTQYKWGGVAERIWYYSKRDRVFQLGHVKGSEVNIPALSLELVSKDSEDRRHIFSMSSWLETIRIVSRDGIYPTPMQLISCWSLHSGIWPSFNSGVCRVRMISGSDGNIYTALAGINPAAFSWAEFEGGVAEEEVETESESESEESESAEEEGSEDEEESGSEEEGSEDEEESGSEEESEDESQDTENSKSERVDEEEDSASEDTENSKSERVDDEEVKEDSESKVIEEEVKGGEVEKEELQQEIAKLRDETSAAIEKLKWHLALANAVDEKPVLVDYKSGVVDMEEVD